MTINDRLGLADKFHRILCEAQNKREEKNRWVDTELEWVLYERITMFDAVNKERLAVGKKVLGLAEFMSAERSATGHCDYTKKFALYCAELVTETP